MSKVRINDLARELEVKSKSILDALTAVGVSEKKTHSSSIEADEAEKVRAYLTRGSRAGTGMSRPTDRPKFDLSKVSKPGDALKAILERKQAEAAAKAAPPVVARPAVVPPPPVVSPPVAPPAAPPRPGIAPNVTAAASTPPQNAPAAAPAPRRIVPLPRPQA
ncbi:MAG TPA: translation initiation factor IF-2 N-terminal domain-containing protein, partial [Edaphobacter sp.]|nr:translation initiation factor IF-2 N-terminal domain-containing protein [Edaphobacter sp.]